MNMSPFFPSARHSLDIIDKMIIASGVENKLTCCTFRVRSQVSLSLKFLISSEREHLAWV